MMLNFFGAKKKTDGCRDRSRGSLPVFAPGDDHSQDHGHLQEGPEWTTQNGERRHAEAATQRQQGVKLKWKSPQKLEQGTLLKRSARFKPANKFNRVRHVSK